jgi:signal transduction histidine kinase
VRSERSLGSPEPWEQSLTLGLGSTVAFVAVVAHGLVSSFFADQKIPRLELSFAALIAIAFVIIGISGAFARRFGPLRYFTVQFALGFSLSALTRGYACLAILPLFSQLSLVLPRRRVLALLAVVTLLLATLVSAFHTPTIGLTGAVGFLSAAAFVITFTEVALRQRRARREVEALAAQLEHANALLVEYSAQLEQLTVVKERERIARELHDSLGHYLTSIHVQLEAAELLSNRDPTRASASIATSHRLVREALSALREAVTSIRRPEEQRPLVDALALLVEGMGQASLEIEGEPQPLSRQAELTLYRAVQEALTNARKHARAKKVEVRLVYQPDRVELSVRDDGAGSEPSGGGFGLIGIKERIKEVGGRFSIRTALGQGFALEVIIPRLLHPAPGR